MKRKIALALAIAMLIPMNITIFADVTTEEAVELYDDFEDLQVGDEPSDEYPTGKSIWDYYGSNVTIEETEYGKSLYVTDNTAKNNVVSTRDIYSFLWAGDAIAEMDIKVGSGVGRAMLYFGAASTNAATDFKFGEFRQGRIYVCGNTSSGAEIGTYTADKWYHVTVKIDFGNKSFDLTITGDDTNITKTGLNWTNNMTECNLRLLVNGTKNAYAYIDNIKIYRPADVEYSTDTPGSNFYVTAPASGPAVEGDDPLAEGTSAFKRIRAINYSKQRNAGSMESCYDNPSLEASGRNISAVNPGGYLMYEKLDFGDGARGFFARVGSWYSGGNIEVRLDNVQSEPVGTLKVTVTGDWQNWETLSCKIDETKGVHDVYLVFTHAKAPIASLNWFTFTENVPAERYTYVSNPKTLDWDTQSDTWVSTDDLGRVTETNDEVGPQKEEKYVGVFYFPHLSKKYSKEINDITKLEAEDPNLVLIPGKTYYWAEPYFGYYRMQDEYVIRKHAQMLIDAGVDFIFHDISNGLLYAEEWMTVFKVFDQIRREGGKTPKVMFFCGNDANVGRRDIDYLWENLYSKELYKDLWFVLDGKPVITANTSLVDADITSNFTVRKSWAWSNASWFGSGKNAWAWLDNYPQNYGWHESRTIPEQISVCAAQHASTSIGRSYHNGVDPDTKETEKGLNFAEQWSRALEVDPKVIFVTGWNEWTAGAATVGSSGLTFLGRQLAAGQGYTVDLYNKEYSRDIEPMKGGFGDNYYYQLVQNIRKYKGASEIPKSSGSKTINIDGDFSQWDDVYPEYRDDKGDTAHRDSLSLMGKYKYTNETGRNDIDYTKVTYDKDYVYFYAHTQRALTEPVLENWMTLYIDADSNHDTGWNGYDFAVNRTLKNNTTGLLEANLFGDWKWEKKGEVFFNVSGNEIQFAVNRTLLNLNGNDIRFDFKWCDNSVTDGDPMEFMDKGDAAPNERFNYRFITGGSNADYPQTDIDKTRIAMDDALVMKTGSSVVYRCGVAEFIDDKDMSVKPFKDADNVMTPIKYLCGVLGAEISTNGDSSYISYNGKTLEVTPGSAAATLSGAAITLNTAPQIIKGNIYMDLTDLAQNLFGNAVDMDVDTGVTVLYLTETDTHIDKFDVINSLYEASANTSLTALYNTESIYEIEEIEKRAFAPSAADDGNNHNSDDDNDDDTQIDASSLIAAYTGASSYTAAVKGAGGYKTVLITKDSDNSIVYLNQAVDTFSVSMNFLLKEDPGYGKYNVKLGSASNAVKSTYFYVGIDAPKSTDKTMIRLGEEQNKNGTYNVGYTLDVSADDYNSTYNSIKVGYDNGGTIEYGGFRLHDDIYYTAYSGSGSIRLIFQIDDVPAEYKDSISIFLSEDSLNSVRLSE